MSEPLSRRKAGANFLAVSVKKLQVGPHCTCGLYILAVDGLIPKTSYQANHVARTSTRYLTEGVHPIRSVTVSGAGISDLHEPRIQEDNIVLPFLPWCCTVRRRNRQPTPVVIPRDLKVFFLRLCSPFVADYNRVGDFRLVQVLSVIDKRHHYKRRFVGMSRYAIVAGHHMKVDLRSRVRRADERNGFKSQRYLVEAFEVDRGDFDVLSGIAAQMVQRKDVALPLVVVALDCLTA